MQNNKLLDNIDFALSRSIIYEALALGFQFPRIESIERLTGEENINALVEVANILDANYQNRNGKSLIENVYNIRKFSGIKDLSSLESSYRYFFGHTAHSKIPPYETEYGEETLFQQPQQLGDITGFFNAFRLKLNVSEHERADHISCELEFLCFLTRKEAYLLERNDSFLLNETCKAQRLFLKDHLGRFVPSFTNLLKREDAEGFYGILGNLCYDFIINECRYYNIQVGAEQLRLRSTLSIDECFSCGAGEPGDETIKLVNK